MKFKDISEFLKEDYKNSSRLWKILYVVAGIIIIGGGLFIAGLALFNLFVFLSSKFEYFILGGILLGGLYMYLNRKKEERSPLPPYIEMVLDEENAMFDYQILGRAIFTLLGSYASMVGLKTPDTVSEILTPDMWTKRGYTVLLFKFICVKVTENFDCVKAKEILQQRLIQMLINHEIDGVAQPSFISSKGGKPYPSILIEKITASGSYAEITVCFPNDEYCEQQRIKALERNAFKSNVDPKDPLF